MLSVSRLAGMPRSAHGMTLAHLGVAVVIVGVTGSSAWKEERIETLTPGQSIDAGGYRFTFDGARSVVGPNYDAVEGTYTVTKDGVIVTALTPERRSYAQPPQGTTEAAIHTTLGGDLYAVIGEPDGDKGGFVTRIFIEPFVPWIWAGVLLMGLGGVVSLSDRRYRIGAARRATFSARVAPRNNHGPGSPYLPLAAGHRRSVDRGLRQAAVGRRRRRRSAIAADGVAEYPGSRHGSGAVARDAVGSLMA